MSRFFDGQVYFNNLPTHKRKHYGWYAVLVGVIATFAILLIRPDWIILLP